MNKNTAVKVFLLLIVLITVLFLDSGIRAEPTKKANPGENTIVFNRDIRPILSENCFQCHGPDKKKRKAKLRLDLRESAISVRKGVAAIIPGEPGKSELISRVLTSDTEEVMPPPESHLKPLKKKQIALLKTWIKEGATYQKHWAFIAPKAPKLPKLKDSSRVNNPIDTFIQKSLEKRGLKPSKEADKRTLIRRVYFDLIGLPPSLEEVEAFVKDKSPKAYENVVDQLLASKHYGERLAIKWLDLVRYADSVGYHGDQDISQSPYRDYVINSFNDNKGFDVFTLEQLAGDLLPGSTQLQKIASGYNRMNPTTEEFGSQAKEYLAKYATDRIKNVSEVWMGATMGCCECHDHKFDPFSSKDFYSFGAFFADITEKGVYSARRRPPEMPVLKPAEEKENQKYLNEVAEIKKRLEAIKKVPLKEQINSEEIKIGKWHTLGPFTAKNHKVCYDTDFGPETKEVYLLETFKDGKVSWKKVKKWTDARFLKLKGNNTAHYYYAEIESSLETDLALFFGCEDSIKIWFNEENVFKKPDVKRAKRDEFHVGIKIKKGSNRLLVKVSNNNSGFALTLRLGTEEEKKKFDKMRPIEKELANKQKTFDAFKKKLVSTPITVAVKPRVMRVLPRGNWMDETGQIVTAAIPATFGVIKGKEGKAPGRMELAKWLTSENNPSGGRVFVNNLWSIYFGTGLSKIQNDLGSQGEWPSHPELLDWLALEFVQNKWDIKQVIKTMVLSHTYKQSSSPRSELREEDPYNRLLSHQNALRLTAELVRDNALKISGLLVPTIGGVSVKPYQPTAFYKELNFPRRKYRSDTGDKQYRRGLYSHWQRTFLHPSLSAFDASSRETCAASRPRSNTPLQSLVLMNDPSFVEAARVFAEKVMKQKGLSDEAKVAWAYKSVLSTAAKPEVKKLLLKLYKSHHKDYLAKPEEAKKLLSVGLKKRDGSLKVEELAAWTSVCRSIFSLQQTITRY